MNQYRHSGGALLMALILLSTAALLSASLAHSARLALLAAGSEQQHDTAFQTADSALRIQLERIIGEPACSNPDNPDACDGETASGLNNSTAELSQAVLVTASDCPPRLLAGLDTACEFSADYFELTVIARSGTFGRSRLRQGYVVCTLQAGSACPQRLVRPTHWYPDD